MAKGTDKDRPLYMISVAAALAGMHPQTLRVYERKALIHPQRSAGNTRLYSEADIDRLRFVQKLSSEGINLSGAIRIIELTDEIAKARRETEELRRSTREAQIRLVEESRRIRESYRAEIVLVRRGSLDRRPPQGE
jgi:MerR family transcriptional regulator/heat shock protein HspR